MRRRTAPSRILRVKVQKKRKKKKVGRRKYLLAYLVLAVIFVLAGVGTVWLKSQQTLVGYEIGKLKKRIGFLKMRKQELEIRLHRIKEPSNLHLLVESRDLGLVPAGRTNRRVPLQEPPPLEIVQARR